MSATAGVWDGMHWLTWWRQRPEGLDVPLGLEALEERINYSFRDKSLLVRALKHRSYVYHALETQQAAERGGNGATEVDANALPAECQANERLEFLGDAVLGVVTTHFLYNRFPHKPEGELTKLKSVLVSKNVLARRATAIGLDQHLLLSELEESAGGRKRRSILGDAFEALLGAMYLDGGLEAPRTFLHRELLAHLDELTRDTTFINYKSLLLEHVQGRGETPPEYRLREQSGPDHRKTFTVEVVVNGEIMGQGVGRSKKDAQQVAAKEAYERVIGAPSGEGVTAADARETAAAVGGVSAEADDPADD